LLDSGGEHQELFARQPRAGRLRVLHGLRKVRGSEGLQDFLARQAAGRWYLRRGIERGAHELPPGPRRDARDAVIDADDPPRVKGTQARDPSGGIAQRKPGARHAGRGSRLSPYDGFQKVKITRPNPTRSPWRIATGTPVDSLTLLTKVPLTTPISSIRYSASP